MENESRAEWQEANISVQEPLEAAKKLVEHLEAFTLYEKEVGVTKSWEDYIKESEDACSHHHSRSRKSKKNKKHKKRVRSSSKSVSDTSVPTSFKTITNLKKFYLQDIENDQDEFETAKLKKRKSHSRSVNMH